jgi:hypothetical protein
MKQFTKYQGKEVFHRGIITVVNDITERLEQVDTQFLRQGSCKHIMIKQTNEK